MDIQNVSMLVSSRIVTLEEMITSLLLWKSKNKDRWEIRYKNFVGNYGKCSSSFKNTLPYNQQI
jgi:hypothetical protein